VRAVACFCTKHKNRDEEDEHLVNTQANASTGYVLFDCIGIIINVTIIIIASSLCFMLLISLVNAARHQNSRDCISASTCSRDWLQNGDNLRIRNAQVLSILLRRSTAVHIDVIKAT